MFSRTIQNSCFTRDNGLRFMWHMCKKVWLYSLTNGPSYVIRQKGRFHSCRPLLLTRTLLYVVPRCCGYVQTQAVLASTRGASSAILKVLYRKRWFLSFLHHLQLLTFLTVNHCVFCHIIVQENCILTDTVSLYSLLWCSSLAHKRQWITVCIFVVVGEVFNSQYIYQLLCCISTQAFNRTSQQMCTDRPCHRCIYSALLRKSKWFPAGVSLCSVNCVGLGHHTCCICVPLTNKIRCVYVAFTTRPELGARRTGQLIWCLNGVQT